MTNFEKEVKATMRLAGHNPGEAVALPKFPAGMILELDSEAFNSMPIHKVRQYIERLNQAMRETFPECRSLVLGPGVKLAAVMNEGETTMRFVNQLREMADKLEAEND